MAIRAFNATLAGLILLGLIYLVTVFLIVDIPVFNPVYPVSLAVVVLAMFLGLAFGLFAGSWFTKMQLKVLSQKNEFRGLGSKKVGYVLFSGLAVFLVLGFLAIYFRLLDLGNSLVVFTISAAFTLFISRLILLLSGKKQNKKIVMMEWNRFYSIPTTDN